MPKKIAPSDFEPSFTIEEVQAKKKPGEVSVDILTNAPLAREIAELVEQYKIQQIRDKNLNEHSKAPGIKKQIDKLKEKARADTYKFIFRDIGREAFEQLQDDWPATEEQKKEGFAYNPNEYGPRLIQATLIQPTLTLDQAKEIYDNWGQGEVATLLNTAVSVCVERTSLPFIGTDLQETQTST